MTNLNSYNCDFFITITYFPVAHRRNICSWLNYNSEKATTIIRRKKVLEIRSGISKPQVGNRISAIKRFGSGFQESVNCRSKFEMLRGYHGSQWIENVHHARQWPIICDYRLAIRTAWRLVKPGKVEWLATGKSNESHLASYSVGSIWLLTIICSTKRYHILEFNCSYLFIYLFKIRLINLINTDTLRIKNKPFMDTVYTIKVVKTKK